MVIAHPVSNSDNRSNGTLIADQDGNVINSNSLESVTSLVSDVRKLYYIYISYNFTETVGLIILVICLFLFSSQKTNGARPQSVSSIHTTAPNTPTLEELQSKLESSNRNIMHIKV